jgi:hypothetical protein
MLKSDAESVMEVKVGGLIMVVRVFEAMWILLGV